LEEHDTSFDYAPSYLDEEMNESAHPIDIPVSPMPLDEEEEWVAPHESITSSVSDELDDFLFSSAYASEPQEMETTETYSTPAAWSPEPIEEPSTNFEEAYPEVKEPDVIYPAYQPPTQGFATGSIQQPYISQPPPMPFEPMGPTMDDFWAHYAPGFDEVVIPPKPPGYPSSEPDHFLDSVHQKLYPDEYDPFAELSATSDEAYPEDLFAIGSKPTLSYFDDPEDLSSVKQFSFESDEDDEQIPDMMPHIHSQESASVAEVSPPSPEPQTNDIQVLGISPLEKDHQLVLVKMNQTIALMGQTGTQSEVVKIFEVSPLTAANNTFTAVKAFEMEGKTMYQVKAGQWNAVMSIDHGVFTIHTELVG
jgi:hypothetical protein